MMRTRFTLSLISVSVVLGCGDIVSLGGGNGEQLGAGGSGGGSVSSSTAVTGSGGGSTVTSSSTGTPTCDGSDPDGDADSDGYSPAQGDCQDCNAAINPNAVEVATNPGETPIDEDCDGGVDNVAPTCDGLLVVDDPDPMNGAKAVDLCKVSSGPGDWGVVTAQWLLPDGNPGPGHPNYDVGHGILTGFGPNLVPQGGLRVLALSSGTARQPTDPGYADVSGYTKGYDCAYPDGFPKESPACPGVVSGAPMDGVALEVTVRVPSNATGFRFDFDFFTYEWPAYICSPFNDVFAALLWPIPAGQTDGNISFDSQANIVSVNSVFLEACGCLGGPPCFAGGKTFDCAFGTDSLVGTGFDLPDPHGSTYWLATSAPADPNSTITIRWMVHDSGDTILDTTTLVDNWQWITQGSPPVVTFRPER
jgi:hypothetical protein